MLTPVSLALIVYPSASLITFLTYRADKVAAKTGEYRVPEKVLHLLSLAGGWPGALAAQKVLRHKTRKQPFRFIFWITVVMNLAGAYWLLFVAHAPRMLE